MKVGIVGLVMWACPWAWPSPRPGNEVVGVDVDPATVEGLRAGRSHVEDIPDATLAGLGTALRATTDYAELAPCQAVIVCVPTPLTRTREPDLTYLVEAAASVAGVLQPGQLVVLESTTYPGTTRERLQPLLEESGMKAGKRLSPRLLPGADRPRRTDHTIRSTPKVVGGLTEDCAERARELYGLICDEVVMVSSPEVAELSKLLENIFRSVNIALRQRACLSSATAWTSTSGR